ncbi:MAG: heavy-metal-associated domain-containing protein [Gemmatimonadota bacterium]|nr:heavy-metal-associated domain-containing protein [Gemmatimonadota bacterium]
MMRLALTIDGMTCGHCVSAVGKALRSVEGVQVDDVKIGAATVTYDPAKTSPIAIVNTVNGAGYQATPQAA